MTPPRRTTAATAAVVVFVTTGGLLAATAAPASAAVTCASPVFKRQFFANTSFSGTPKKTDCDTTISENWGTKAPATGLPKDKFGVRWTVTRDFGSGGPFGFTAASQDGIRVYLDGKRKVDLWKNVSSTAKKTVNVTIPSGKHTLRVDFVNWTGAANVSFVYAPRTTASVDKVKPLAPAGAAVTYDTKTGKAKLSWAKNKEMDLAGYRVYRRGKSGSFPAKPLATTTYTTYTDTTLPKSGSTFLYEVRAYDKAGNVSTGTADQSVTTVDRLAPTVTGLKVVGASALDGVTFTWWPGETELTTQLLRSDSPDGPFEVAATNLGSSAVDETAPYGETSYYKIASTDAAGNTGYSSVVSYARPLAEPYFYNLLNRPENGGGVDLFWKVSPHAPSEFRVHRLEHRFDSATNQYVTVDNRVVPCTPKLTDTAYGTQYTYTCTDTTVVPGRFYTYGVTTVDTLGRESEQSTQPSITYGDATAPPLVTGFTATATAYGTVLDWDDSPVTDIAEYHLYRLSTVDDGTEYTYVGRVEAGTSRFVDSANLQDGETHTYFVDAVDTSGNTTNSSADNLVSTTVTEDDLRPTVETPEGRLVTAHARAADGGNGVDLTWELPSSDNGSDITGYRIHRWNPATAAYEPLTAEPVTGTSYTDTTAAAGTTHFYWATALHADGTESAPGDAWVALAP